MTTVNYQSSKMLSNVIGCAALAIAGLWVGFFTDWHWKLRFLGGFLGLTLPFVSGALALRIRSGLAALEYDRNTLKIATFYRVTSHRWPEVRNISRETLTHSSGFGLFKRDVAHYLVVTVADESGMQNSYRLQEELLDWPKDSFPALVEQMTAAWMGQRTHAADRSPTPVQTSSGPAMLNSSPIRPSVNAGFGRRGL